MSNWNYHINISSKDFHVWLGFPGYGSYIYDILIKTIKVMKLSETRMKLLTDIHLLIPNADKNQIATAIGTIGETIVCDAFGWKNIDEDGFDAIDDEGALYEIKTMSNETNTHYVAYNHSKKKDRYDYLVVFHYDLDRVSIIPREVINEYIDTISTTLRLNFNESLLTTLGKQRQSARFQAIFEKYESKNFKR